MLAHASRLTKTMRRFVERPRASSPEQLLRESAGKTRRLHLACGIAGLGHGAKILKSWTNVDIEADGLESFAWNLTQPLPIPPQTIDFIYHEHFIEHLPLEEGRRLVAECRRLLRPGGVMRISTPDLEVVVKKYLAGEIREWSDMGWVPASPCDLVNEALRNWGHHYVFDERKLIAVLVDAGFVNVGRRRWGHSDHAALERLETRPDHGDLIVEATA